MILEDGQTIAITWDSKNVNEAFLEHKSKEYLHDKTVYETSIKEKEPLSLDDCINEFLAPEVLDGDDLWFCSCCKEHQQSSKKMDLWKLPPVLIIHLKRFEQVGNKLCKIDKLVQFPIDTLDLSQYIPQGAGPQETTYELFACLNHYGQMRSGHYTAFAKNKNDKKWYCFDDGRCSVVEDVTTLQSKAAYLLFYIRKNHEPIDFSQIEQKAEVPPDPNCKLM
uniref:ubiquitinyl hydrolase 1 n=1 Tax=Arcella intermedia TaxID=1963864 RepID=A0A6B2LH68_9EUKA